MVVIKLSYEHLTPYPEPIRSIPPVCPLCSAVSDRSIKIMREYLEELAEGLMWSHDEGIPVLSLGLQIAQSRYYG